MSALRFFAQAAGYKGSGSLRFFEEHAGDGRRAAGTRGMYVSEGRLGVLVGVPAKEEANT